VFKGVVTGSDEAFAAESNSAAQKRFPLVRTSVGQSRNLRNNSIYDRHLDWILSGPPYGQTRIVPGQPSTGKTTFSIQCDGQELAFVFRPRYYQVHKGLKNFAPWSTGKLRQDSITGWCSWWPYHGDFDQKALTSLLDVWRDQHMADYGYRIIQIDDCFQSGWSTPDHWLKWNNKFPAGMQGFADAVKNAGLTPGVWIAATYKEPPVLPAQADWFLRGLDGKPFRGQFVGYIIDATIPAAADALVKPIFRGFHDAGFSYVKIDTLRHRFYDGINHCLPDIEARGLTPDECFRSYIQAARSQLGEKTFILACWGVLPEAIGLADGCRLTGDGFSPSSLQCYNSWNGVVWRNDPDHCDVLPVRKGVDSGDVLKTETVSGSLDDTILRPTLVSMAGGMLMLSDKPEVYQNSKAIEGARRASPVLLSVPGQLDDYDPSRSERVVTIPRNTNEAQSIDAGGGQVCPWWLMEVDRSFEHWAVLSRLNFADAPMPATTVHFRDLGLDDEQLVWEFWMRRLVAVRDGGFEAETLGPRGTRTYAIRPRLDHPQLLSTSRHISQGGADLEAMTWNPATRVLSGRSRVVNQDPYELAIHVPAPFICRAATVAGTAAQPRTEGEVLLVAYTPPATTTIDWSVQF